MKDAQSILANFNLAWGNIVNAFVRIIDLSTNTATNVAAYATDFTENVIPYIANQTDNGAIPLDNAIQTIQGFIAEAGTLQSSALATAQSFSNFQTNLSVFSGTFQAFARSVNMMDNLTIDGLENDIKSLNITVQSLDTQIAGIAKEIDATAIASVAVLSIFPIFGELGVRRPDELINQRKERDQRKITSDESSIKTLEAHDALIIQANEAINDVKELSLDTTFRIGAFDAIWAAVVDDCRQVIDYLNDAAEIPLVLWSTLNNVACYYQSLADALQLHTLTEKNLEKECPRSDQKAQEGR
ncbi:hypothetical protein CPB84DRAFT_1752190 [Gymnopilus junonius]|uniref:Uncharacterized protein n=1 Tax=Gymnopilus junonius TaxID=109634 RepID=A0A9P5THZ6_GYMJU|nr:hypothetical protein CPB84DRAFT_1752190 [Gymnopilus junonius]